MERSSSGPIAGKNTPAAVQQNRTFLTCPNILNSPSTALNKTEWRNDDFIDLRGDALNGGGIAAAAQRDN